MALQNDREQIMAKTDEIVGSSNEETCDLGIVIKCGNQEFITDRAKLCKFSKKIRQMSKGIRPNQEWEINMTTVSEEILYNILRFVQLEDVRIFKDLSCETLFSCASLAHSMEMAELETCILTLLLKKSKSYSTVAYLWDLSNKYGNKEAENDILRFIVDNIVDMLAKGFFKAISWEQLCCLMRHFSTLGNHDNLCAAAVQWLKMDSDKNTHVALISRRLHWEKLALSSICKLIFSEPLFRRMMRFAMNEDLWSPPQFITSLLNNQKQSSMNSRSLEDGELVSFNPTEEDTLTTQIAPYMQSWQHNLPIEQSLPTKTLVAYSKPNIGNPTFLLLGATRNNSLAIQVYFVNTREWAVPVDTTMQYRNGFGCSYTRQKLYILGGDRGNGFMFEQCYTYDVYHYTLQKLTPFRHARSEAGVVISGGNLYVLGGKNEKHEAVSLGMNMSLNDRFEMWRPIKTMKDKRILPGVTVDPFGNIYVIGGHSTSCEYYNNNGWIEMESLPLPYNSQGMQAVYYDQKVYAFKDLAPQEVCIFDLLKNDLKILRTNGTSPDRIASACCFGSEIWIITPKGLFFIYCIDKNRWKKTQLKSNDMCECFYMVIIEEDDVRTFENKPNILALTGKD